MTELTIYADHDPTTVLKHHTDPQDIQVALAALGVHFERWAPFAGDGDAAVVRCRLPAWPPGDAGGRSSRGGVVAAGVVYRGGSAPS